MTPQEMAAIINRAAPELRRLCEDQRLYVEFTPHGISVLVLALGDASSPTRFATMFPDAADPHHVRSETADLSWAHWLAEADGIKWVTNSPWQPVAACCSEIVPSPCSNPQGRG